jgi:hypothetical protein
MRGIKKIKMNKYVTIFFNIISSFTNHPIFVASTHNLFIPTINTFEKNIL